VSDAAQLCFAEDVIDGALMARLVSDHELGFTPKTLESDRFRDLRSGPKALERLASTGRFSHAQLHDGEQEASFGVSRVGGHQLQQLVWVPERPDVLPDAVEEITRLPGLTAAYLSDDGDAFWQSTSDLSTYAVWGRPHDHLPKVAGGPAGAAESIDISRNWGRRILFADLWLWAAARMWFGPGAFKWLDRDRLLALPVGEVTERDDDVVRVDLFALDWLESNLDEARERQRVFWDWMGLAELDARRAELEREHEPDVDVEPGAFEHGGVRRITEWLDPTGRSRRGSEAGWRRRTEFARDGAIVHQETASASPDDV
jgi:hypothetical protein